MKLLLPLLFALAALSAPASTFSFWFTSQPTQCANTTVQWSGGQPPYTLLLVPVGHLNPETRTIAQFDIEQGNEVTFQLLYPAQSQFVAVLNDATGIGSGGTSVVTTVSSSSTTSCLNTQPVTPKFTFFLNPSTPSSCSPLDISLHSNAEEPIDILGIIPGGESFTIANITDPSSLSSSSQSGLLEFNWTAVNLRSGTDILLVAGDKDGLGTGGSTDILSIQPNAGDDMRCISDNSPSSTPGNPAGDVYTSVPNLAGGTTGTSPTPAPSEGSGSGSGSDDGGSGSGSTPGSGNPTAVSGGAPNSASNTASGAGGTATGTGAGNGGISTGTGATAIPNPSQHPSQTNDPGSGGGTVTGPPDPSSAASRLPLILALTLGLIALLALLFSAFVLYRRHKRREAGRSSYAVYPYPRSYSGIRPGRGSSRFPFSLSAALSFPWTQHENDSASDLLTGPRHGIGTRMRGGDASVDTLGGSLYQTEPFIVPPVHSNSVSDSASARERERDRTALGGTAYNTDGYFLLPPGAAAATIPRPAMVQRGSSLLLQPQSTAEKGPPRTFAHPRNNTILVPRTLSTTAGDGHSPPISRVGSRNPFLTPTSTQLEEGDVAVAAVPVTRRGSRRKGDRIASSSSSGAQGYTTPLPQSYTRPTRESRDSEDHGAYDEGHNEEYGSGHEADTDADPFAIPSTHPRPRRALGSSLQRRGAGARRSRGGAVVRRGHGENDDNEAVEIPPTYNSLRRMSLRMSREGINPTPQHTNDNGSPTSPTSPVSLGGGSPTSTTISHMHLPLPLPSMSLLTPPLPTPAPTYRETENEPEDGRLAAWNGEASSGLRSAREPFSEIPIHTGSHDNRQGLVFSPAEATDGHGNVRENRREYPFDSL